MEIEQPTIEICGCGRKLRYSHFSGDDTVMSCNKHVVCMTYDEQLQRIKELNIQNLQYQQALLKIVDVNGMDYEYKAWAKAGLDT